MLLSFRFGEATNPGPIFGSVNPTGLLGKAAIVHQLPFGVYSICESHLTAAGLCQFRKELAAQGNQMRYFSSSNAPLIRSAVGVIGGKSTGVGFLSNYPGRNLPTQWEHDVLQEARTHVSAFFVENVWVKCGVCYGYARHPTTLATRSKTDDLLAKVVQRIVFECTGPRIVMGDWNQHPGILPQELVLRQQGFVEIQQHMAAMQGREVSFTCKGASIKDFVWISPELIPYLHAVTVDNDLFADHAVLSAHFRSFGSFQTVPLWRKPAPLPWEEVSDNYNPPCSIQIDPSDLQQTIAAVMHDFEQSVHEDLLSQNKAGLQPIHRGRSATLSPTLCRQPIPPNKTARRNEVNPSFMGEHFQHVQWLKQLRRLQSLVALLSNEPLRASHVEHGTALWRAILRAPGFSMSFSKFWVNRAVFLQDAPCQLPQILPNLHIASLIFATFQLEFQHFENALKSKRSGIAQENRKANPVKVFTDVSMPRALPVQTVARNEVYTITDISEDGLHCTVTPTGLRQDYPICVGKELLPTKTISDDGFTLALPRDLMVGSTVTQKIHLGTRSEVLAEFEKLWMQYWGRNHDTTAARWTPFVDMCQHVLPPSEDSMDFKPIDPETWIRAVRRRKQRSATGPDGISRVDLLRMGSSHRNVLVKIISLVEQGAKWPVSCLNGLISSLAKKETSEFVHEFRPICVFSLLYRCWSSIRAKEVLQFLSARAPTELIGNRPRHETADIWWSIACQVEHSYHGGPPLAGAIADITKCFNALPRVPIFSLARLLQLPKAFCDTWCQALTFMQRRFVVEGGVGQPLLTTNGYPEGDPLSVCAMFMVNLALHAFSLNRNPQACVWTFVDDWQITGFSPQDVLACMDSVRAFCDMLGITLDDLKTFFWGTTGNFRQHFRALGHTVRLHLRNLGGHVNYSRMATNHTITNRLTQGTQFWHQLKRSHAPLDQKLRLLPVVAWPRFLHGAAGVQLGDEHFRKLRSKAMQSLSFNCKGANPLLQFGGILHPKHDPAFHVIIATIRSFRRFCIPGIAYPMLNSLVTSRASLRGPGPCEVFLSRIHSLGWSWNDDGFLCDHEGFQIHIIDSLIQVLYQRVVDAWIAHIGATVSVREGFQGLENMSPQLTWGDSKWDSESFGLLRVICNGSFFTRDKQFATGKVPTTACPFCKHPDDSIIHRHYSCMHFQHVRDQLPAKFFGFLEHVPECTLQHGWMCHPPSLHAFRETIANLPDLTYVFCGASLVSSQGPLHLFTDGSCAFPAEPLRRMASWGFCAADLTDGGFTPVAHGPVWGLFQTVLRGEYTACISAYQFALLRNQVFWIWTDSQLVYDFLSEVDHGANFDNIMAPDHDLKSRLGKLHLEAIHRNLLVKVVKVRSHMNVSLFSDKVEQWAFRGNDQADACAARGLDLLTSDFRALWNRLGDELERITFIRTHLHTLFVQVGQIAVQSKNEIRNADAQLWDADPVEEVVVEEPSRISCQDLPPHFDFGQLARIGYRTLGPLAPVVYSWFYELVSSSEGVPQWVNTYQLLVIFQQQTGYIGLKRDPKGRLYHQITQWDASQDYDFLQTAGDFGIFLRALLKKVGTIFEFKKRRPAGTSFRGWTNCVRLQIPNACVVAFDRFLISHQLAPIQDVKRSLKHTPLAVRAVS